MQTYAEVTFSGSALLGYMIEILYSFTFNIILFFVLRRRRGGYSLKPLIIGFGTFFAVSWVMKACKALLLTDSLKTFPAMWYLTAALIPGILEELGRYIAMKYALDGRDSLKDAVSYGLGHDFCEQSFGIGTKSLNFFIWGTRCNKIGIMGMVAGMEPLQADAFAEKLTNAADNSVISSLLMVISWLPVLQILLSVLVMISVYYVGQKKQLYIAMGIHIFMDILSPLMLWMGFANILTVTLIPDVILFIYVSRLWKKLNAEN